MLLKVTPPIKDGNSVSHLGRLKVRMKHGWATIPDRKHLQNLFQQIGFGEDRVPGRVVATPGIKRNPEPGGDLPSSEPATAYRSAVGSMTYYSLDMELLTFAVKELARGLHTPTCDDWNDLKRLGRWAWENQDVASLNMVDTPENDQPYDFSKPVPIVVKYDADWAGNRKDRRSTTGIRATIRGLRISHASQTQPGLPSLSSAEAELRAMAKAAVEGLYWKQITAEMGIRTEIILQGDASAANLNAARLGPGRIKHLEAACYFIKEAIRKKLLRSIKIPRAVNMADIHTHHLDPAEFRKRQEELGYMLIRDFDAFTEVKMRNVNQFEDLKPWTEPSAEVVTPPLVAIRHVTFDDTEVSGINLNVDEAEPTSSTAAVAGSVTLSQERTTEDEIPFTPHFVRRQIGSGIILREDPLGIFEGLNDTYMTFEV